MGEIKIGTCGYGGYTPPGDWKKRYADKLQAYADLFDGVEINRTFYKLPMVKTTERWRREVPEDFEFSIKAWQAVTHPATSPTWRKHLDQLTEEAKEKIGLFRPNREVRKAWEETMKRAEALDAAVCVLQCPAAFDSTEQNEKNMRQFFDKVESGSTALAWEPRGNWNEHPDRIRELCRDLNLVHVVDILRRDPVSSQPIAYIRLHGLNRREYDYNYDYSEEELKRIADKLKTLSGSHDKVYCMFNNNNMFENANRLREILS